MRFLASEFTTSNGGRIDTLGLDENGCPVILEYTRASNENVTNRGLSYLDWLMDYRKDFNGWSQQVSTEAPVSDQFDVALYLPHGMVVIAVEVAAMQISRGADQSTASASCLPSFSICLRD